MQQVFATCTISLPPYVFYNCISDTCHVSDVCYVSYDYQCVKYIWYWLLCIYVLILDWNKIYILYKNVILNIY